MTYYVIALDGSEYGPADETVLRQWLAEGRLNLSMSLRPSTGGPHVPASSILTTAQTYQAYPAYPTGTKKYSVIGENGTRYTAVDADMLTQWASEGRLNHATQVEEEGTGIKMRAADVPGIILNPIVMPGTTTPASPYQANPYLTNSYQATNYPRNLTGGYDTVPQQCQGGFNFGAFVFTWIWGLAHRQWWTLLFFIAWIIPCGSIAFAIFCGVKGNEFAWKSGRFSTPEECLRTQRTWSIVGAVLFIAAVAFYGIMFMAAMSQ